jgi:SAM-dependent methyltransferase
MLCSDWKLALDFGCGTGRNFELFAFTDPPSRRRSLFGVEPDKERLAASKTIAAQYQKYFDNLDAFASIEDVDRLNNGGSSFDVVLACQVFGHVNTTQAPAILSCLAERMASGGALIICIPFHVGMAKGDFFHYVKLDNIENTEFNRVTISEDDFNQLADNPQQDMLPVRAFALQNITELIHTHALPVCVDRSPLRDSPDTLKTVSSLIYSIHDRFDDDKIIGDLIIKLIK